MEKDWRDEELVALARQGLAALGAVIVLGIVFIMLQNQAFLAVEDAVFGPYFDEQMDDLDRRYSMVLGSIYGDAQRTVCTEGFDMEADCSIDEMLGTMEDMDIGDYDAIGTYYRDAFRVSYVNSLKGFVPRHGTGSEGIPQAESLTLPMNVALYNIAAAGLYRSIDDATDRCERNGITPSDCFSRIQGAFNGFQTDRSGIAVDDCAAFPVGEELQVFDAGETGNVAVDTLTWTTRPRIEATFNSSVVDFCQAVDAIDSQLLRHIYSRAFYMSVMAIVTADATTRTQEQMQELEERIEGAV